MGKYQGIIFDLDGVICSTDDYHYRAWKKLADELNIEFTKDDNNRQRGVSRMESLDILLEKSKVIYSYEEKVKFAEYKNNLYKEYLNDMSTDDLSLEVNSTLNILKEKGLKLAIGSSSKNAKFILEKLGLIGFFHAISDGNNIKLSKPDPEVFLKAAEYINLKPENCLVIEDAKAGIEAAYNGGFDSVAIGDAKESNLATYKINYFSDILKIVDKNLL